MESGIRKKALTDDRMNGMSESNKVCKEGRDTHETFGNIGRSEAGDTDRHGFGQWPFGLVNCDLTHSLLEVPG